MAEKAPTSSVLHGCMVEAVVIAVTPPSWAFEKAAILAFQPQTAAGTSIAGLAKELLSSRAQDR